MADTLVSNEEGRRILDAALHQFAEHGFKGATVRDIAEEAGVSLGMLQRRFPSKQALRDECDSYALGLLRAMSGRVRAGSALSDDIAKAVAVLTPYTTTAMLGGGPAAARMFDEVTEFYREILPIPEGEDVEAIVAVYTAMQLGTLMLGKHLDRRLGTSVARVGRARMFLATTPLVDERTGAQVREGLEKYENGTADDH
jgi:AcrR family transcriptional regulator